MTRYEITDNFNPRDIKPGQGIMLSNENLIKCVNEITRIKSANAQLRGACKVALGFIKLEHLSARGEPIGSTIRILEHALKDSEI